MHSSIYFPSYKLIDNYLINRTLQIFHWRFYCTFIRQEFNIIHINVLIKFGIILSKKLLYNVLFVLFLKE